MAEAEQEAPPMTAEGSQRGDGPELEDMVDNLQETTGQYPGWGSFEQQAPLDESSIKEAFNAFAEPGLQEVKTENIRKLVQYLRLPIPDNLDKLTLSVAEGSRSLSYGAVRTLCGLIYGKGPLLESSNKAKQVGSRRTYLESGNITEDEAVLSFMRALEDHKKKCEKEGKYMEARTAAKRLHDLKLHEEQKHITEMKTRHETEFNDAHRAFAMEQEQHNRMWDAKLQDYEDSVAEQLNRLKQMQLEKLEKFFHEAEIKRPRRPQFSKQLLNQRKIQEALAKQSKYEEAEAVKKMADKMEAAEMEATQGTYEAEVALREQQLRVKQTQEMEALLHRGARGRDELQHTRKLDMERRQQRFKNVMNELHNLQRLEHVQLEHFLEQQSVAGKRHSVARAVRKK
uniref:Uncharacterized protein n=1 Tax=Pyramimonas obovata TaxID=1411642 RepID=A0A7S0R1E2_9CHLO|mmetsp:Transcript_2305/g.4661  ORF Transcript_2305/g.4661 Transcript_2305/m.4661 type:complete len:399 (+) Transcript_2305:155-1351(+)|eukprot:CAMPEP_0118928782 /NCGR_PEP_ID=MMETSP1169-20130426/5954_1 /TAXON_ID=36882 /ORGANISM="Pyramimonas obovata, Strain CCMP722" /LENGTH=398 /DNA_ID=CAMNT_0006870837 /DNA_START=78 /DNA_END=1274 /DNA_ORIENTATION=-